MDCPTLDIAPLITVAVLAAGVGMAFGVLLTSAIVMCIVSRWRFFM